MDNYRITVYLDSLRAGHAYLELKPAGSSSGEVFGFYPAKFDEKREVLFGEGMLRKDSERLASSKADENIDQHAKDYPQTQEEFERALNFVREQSDKPNYYFLVGYNCIDFIQDVFQAAKGEKATSFLRAYKPEELAELSWVGAYAKLRRIPG